jgi:hypothetical protein
MIVLIVGFLCTIGSLMIPEEKRAMNMTLKNTDDNRVQFSTMTFEDGKACNVKGDIYTFNTDQDAIQRWNSWSPPVLMKRNVPAWNIYNLECTVQDSTEHWIGTGGILLLTIAFTCMIDRYILFCIKTWYRARFVSSARSPPPLLTRIHVEVHKSQTEPLSAYTAKLIAEACIGRGDKCPINLEPLSLTEGVYVPDCGHCIGPIDTLPEMCSICRKKVIYIHVKEDLPIPALQHD